jgi:hypothetical protein
MLRGLGTSLVITEQIVELVIEPVGDRNPQSAGIIAASLHASFAPVCN